MQLDVATQLSERAMMRSNLMRMGAGELVMTTFMKLTMMLMVILDSDDCEEVEDDGIREEPGRKDRDCVR